MTFNIGQKYSTRSICDHDCIYTIEVVARTAKTVTVTEHGKRKTLRTFPDYNGHEAVRPHGRYSMAAVISADDKDLS